MGTSGWWLMDGGFKCGWLKDGGFRMVVEGWGLQDGG